MIKIDEIKINDRVICNEDYNGIIHGMKGTIIEIRRYDVGVKWDNWHNGHNCNGHATDDGWYIPCCSSISKDNSMTIFRVNSSGSFRIRQIKQKE